MNPAAMCQASMLIVAKLECASYTCNHDYATSSWYQSILQMTMYNAEQST